MVLGFAYSLFVFAEQYFHRNEIQGIRVSRKSGRVDSFCQEPVIFQLEVLARLVPAAVFKTVEPHGNHVVGGFDSHAFPPLNRQVV